MIGGFSFLFELNFGGLCNKLIVLGLYKIGLKVVEW